MRRVAANFVARSVSGCRTIQTLAFRCKEGDALMLSGVYLLFGRSANFSRFRVKVSILRRHSSSLMPCPVTVDSVGLKRDQCLLPDGPSAEGKGENPTKAQLFARSLA